MDEGCSESFSNLDFNDVFPPTQGMAIFMLHSALNHSCCPNARCSFEDTDERAIVRVHATRAIAEGEEITISYFGDDVDSMSLLQRREALALQYLFHCECVRCLEEEGNSSGVNEQ